MIAMNAAIVIVSENITNNEPVGAIFFQETKKTHHTIVHGHFARALFSIPEHASHDASPQHIGVYCLAGSIQNAVTWQRAPSPSMQPTRTWSHTQHSHWTVILSSFTPGPQVACSKRLPHKQRNNCGQAECSSSFALFASIRPKVDSTLLSPEDVVPTGRPGDA